MEDQLTLRLPREVARALGRLARQRGVPKSQLVREALREYLGTSPAAPQRAAIRERLEAYRGIVRLDRAALGTDPLALRILRHNWRE